MGGGAVNFPPAVVFGLNLKKSKDLNIVNPLIFGLPDPILFSPDQDSTCKIIFIFNINQYQQIKA